MTAEEILREEFYNKPSVESCFARTIGITYSSGEIDQSEIFSKDEMIAFAEHFHKKSSKELVEALEKIVDIKNNIRHYEDFDLNLMEAIDQAERALENHLK